MSTPFLPQSGMAIVDKNGKPTMQLMQFFMRLAQGSGAISITVSGNTKQAQSVNFGSGFDGAFSGTALNLSTGLDVIDAEGESYPTTSTITFGEGFEVSDSGAGLKITGGGSSLQIWQNGAQISDGIDVINFTGSVTAKVEGGEVYINVNGGVTDFVQGTLTATGEITIGSGLTLTGNTLSGGGGTGGGIEFDGTLYSTIAAGSGVTITPGGETLTFSASGGGGGNSPYTVPLLSQFTAINTPSGATASDTSTGLACYTPQSGRSLLMLADNTAPGITFTITAGFNDQGYGADTASAIFVRDAAGKSLIFCTNASSSSYFGGLVSEWSNNTTYAGVNLSQKTSNKQVNFLRVVYNGTTLSFYTGNDLNGLSLIYSASATAYLTAISSVGICQQGNSGPINTTFFHYTHTL